MAAVSVKATTSILFAATAALAYPRAAPAQVTGSRPTSRSTVPAEQASPPSDDGRVGLIATSTALGLTFYGWAAPSVLDTEDGGAVGSYLLAAGSSFLLPYLLTRDRPVTVAQRNAVAWGATRGILYGVALGDALTGGEEADDWPESNDRDVALAMGMAASVAGGLLGYAWGGQPGVDEDYVAFRATMADFAMAYGFGISAASGLYRRDAYCRNPCWPASEVDPQPAGHLAAMGLAAAGTWAARYWPSARSYTLGDTRTLRSFGLLGAQVTWPFWVAAVDNHLDDDGAGHARSFLAASVLGSVVGLVAGHALLRDRELSPSDGLKVLAGHFGGGLGAFGLTFLVFGEGYLINHETLLWGAAAVGSLAGSLLMFHAVGDADSRPVDPEGPGGGLRVELAPVSVALVSALGDRSGPRMHAPLVTLRF